MKASFCKNTFEPYNVEIKNVIDLLDAIKEGKYKNEIDKVRNEQDPDKKNEYKTKLLSGVVWMGRFSYRNRTGLLQHNGLAILDFDHLEDAESFRDKLKKDKWIYSAWCSPSGDGVKALARIPVVQDDDQYKEYYTSLLEHYKNADSDSKTTDISRLCFNSYDPDLWINNKAEIWTDKIIITYDNRDLPEIPYYSNENETIEKLEKWLTKKGDNYTKGNRNNYVFLLSAACNRFGIVRSSAEGYIISNYDLPEREILQSVGSAYKDTNAHGTARFENKAEFAKIVSKVSKGVNKKEIIKNIIDDGIKINDADEIYAKAIDAVKNKLETFWITQFKNDKVSLNSKPLKYIDWLNAAGFYKYYYSDNAYMLVNVDRNIIKEITIDRIRSYVKKYILSLPYQFDMITREQLFEFVFIKAEKQFFGNSTIELLNALPIRFVKDKKNKAYLYFKNTAIEIMHDIVQPIKYEEIGGYIWDNQIIDREFKEIKTDVEDFEFCDFMKNITGSMKNYNSLKSIAGYMLHGYKSPDTSIAPILNDCILSEGINGGTGKGLFVRALGEIKPMITLDAKNWDINKDFAFQRITLDTDIIFIDDVQKKFDFEKLFSIITEGISVNRKNKPEFYISFKDSPKIIISTNYAISGEGDSHERRKIEIEFIKYYHKKRTPKDEFGRFFYNDWKESDWHKFDNFMIYCIQYYMSNGLVESKLENLEMKRLITDTTELFVDWVTDENTFSLDTEYNIADLFNDFISFTGYKRANIGYLGKLLKRYAHYLNEPYNSVRRSMEGYKNTYVSIGNVKESNTEVTSELPF